MLTHFDMLYPNPAQNDTQSTAAILPDDVVLRVRNVSKKFCRHLRRSMWYGIQDLARNFVGLPPGGVLDPSAAELDLARAERAADDQCLIMSDGQRALALRPHEFWALRDVSVEVRRGEVLGLIGMNGCGKTTLLRLIAGIFPPDLGEIAIRGRTGALIALGAGFHPYMTGRENVHLNAAILGLSRQEIRDRFQDIIDFAEIGPFIDAPVSTYSSGMRVKLGFAIAINVQADLLLIDEVLAVGDMGFKIKCLNAIRALMADTAVVFVSHSMQFISSFCTRVMVMEAGQIVCDTPSVELGIDRYLELFPQEKLVSGTGEAIVDNLVLSSGGRSWSGDEEGSLRQSDELTVSFDVRITNPEIHGAKVSAFVMDQGLDPVVCFHSVANGTPTCLISPRPTRVTLPLGKIDLNAGKYSLVLGISNADSGVTLARLQGVGRFRVLAERFTWGRITRETNVQLERI
jgi:lipopolysaccharide transport system ATP-binding protein